MPASRSACSLLCPFAEEDESPFVGLLQIDAASGISP